MSSQTKLENVLRDIHVMISKSEKYDADRIIVSKQDIFNLIDRLNGSIYEIMDEYELTQQSRDRALREKKKEGDRIIWDASRQAEDIYAASVLYTEEALNHLNVMVDEADATVDRMYKEFQKNIKMQQETIRDNQLELKSQLQLLADTEKYLRLIEERNREIERERADKKGRKTLENFGEKHTVIKPEIRINEDYFRKAGIPFEKEEDKKAEDEEMMQPLEDEGVIESTLKRAAADIQHLFAEDLKAESEYEENPAKRNVRKPFSGKERMEKPDDGNRKNSAESLDYDEKAFDEGKNTGELEVEKMSQSTMEASEGSISQDRLESEGAMPQGTSQTTGGHITTNAEEAVGSHKAQDVSEGANSQMAQDSSEAAGVAQGVQEAADVRMVQGVQEAADSRMPQKMQEGADVRIAQGPSDLRYAADAEDIQLTADVGTGQNENELEGAKQPHHEKLSLLDKLMGKKKTLL